MFEFLVILDNEEIICVVQAKSESQAKEKFKQNFKKWERSGYKCIEESLNGKEEFRFTQYGCDQCEYADSMMKTCWHKCVQDNEWWFNIYYSYFKENKELAEITVKLKDGLKVSREETEKVIDFIIKEEDILKYYEFVNLQSINHYK